MWAVGQEDALDRDAGLSERVADAVKVAARIDHHAALYLVVPQQRAVLLERRDRNDRGTGFGHGRFQIHWFSLRPVIASCGPAWRPIHLDDERFRRCFSADLSS
jgi:hypothetical protein